MSRSAEPSPSIEPLRPTKRARTRTASRSSSSLSSPSFPSPRRDNGKGKAPSQGTSQLEGESGIYSIEGGDAAENGVEDEESVREARRKAHSDRIKRAWETRRANRALYQSAQLRNEVVSDLSTLSTPIPTTDLLLSIHRYTSAFYTTHSLLFPPEKKVRHNPWGSKKRLLLIKDGHAAPSIVSNSIRARENSNINANSAGVSERHGSSASTSTMTRTRTRSTTSRRQRSDLDQEEASGSRSGSGSGSGSGSEDEQRALRKRIKVEPGSELVDQYGELEDRKGRKKERKERRTGSYKIRDMYKAIEGEGLMALGMILQEHIIAKLDEAGYRQTSHGMSPDHDLERGDEDPENDEEEEDGNHHERESDEVEEEKHGEESQDSSANRLSFLDHQVDMEIGRGKNNVKKKRDGKRRPGFG
ncbi:hypothetical protein IAR55_006526 [Kwoniella newhampshirensis]|uniref:Uncharacterized protein n=1 Tax=Kwoniella newhampshirensis TaxID=1651941 RepID=A0AAW0YTD5_9TREE